MAAITKISYSTADTYATLLKYEADIKKCREAKQSAEVAALKLISDENNSKVYQIKSVGTATATALQVESWCEDGSPKCINTNVEFFWTVSGKEKIAPLPILQAGELYHLTIEGPGNDLRWWKKV